MLSFTSLSSAYFITIDHPLLQLDQWSSIFPVHFTARSQPSKKHLGYYKFITTTKGLVGQLEKLKSTNRNIQEPRTLQLSYYRTILPDYIDLLIVSLTFFSYDSLAIVRETYI